MGIRAIAVRDGASARLRVVPRVIPSYRPETLRHRPSVPVVSARAHGVRLGLWSLLVSDRQLVGLKVVLLGLIVLLALALEVPW